MAPLRPGFPVPFLKEGRRRSFGQTLAELLLARLARRSGFPLPLVGERTVAAGALPLAGLPVLRRLDFFVVPLLMFKGRLSFAHVVAFLVTFAPPGFGCPERLPLAFEALLRPAVPAFTGSIPFEVLRFTVMRPTVAEERQAGLRGLFFAREFRSAFR